MWCDVVWQMHANVSQEHTTSIFRVEDYAKQADKETSKQHNDTSQMTIYSL
jgi:hypothetical protein